MILWLLCFPFGILGMSNRLDLFYFSIWTRLFLSVYVIPALACKKNSWSIWRTTIITLIIIEIQFVCITWVFLIMRLHIFIKYFTIIFLTLWTWEYQNFYVNRNPVQIEMENLIETLRHLSEIFINSLILIFFFM